MVWSFAPRQTIKVNIVVTLCTPFKNKAKAISAELLELDLKNKLEEMGKTRWNEKKREETEKLEEKNTDNRKKLKETGRNRKKGKKRKKQKETGRNDKKQ